MKKLIAVFVLLAMLLILSGCGLKELEMRIDAIEDRLDHTGDIIETKAESALAPSAPQKQAQPDNGKASSPKAMPEAKLSSAEAESLALEHAGLKAEDVSHLRSKLDYDDGRLEYEVSFRHGSMEYEYDIHADDGSVLSFDMDD